MSILIALALQAAAPAPPPAPSPGEIVAAAPAGEWVAIAPADLLVMELAPLAKERPRTVVIQLMPPPFSQGWIGNIRKLAAAKWWDGTSVNRVQDNYVVQWGDATEKKPLPAGLATVAQSTYITGTPVKLRERWLDRLKVFDIVFDSASKKSDVQLDEINRASSFVRDSYGYMADNWQGWSIAGDEKSIWPVHCYAMVGVGRNLAPDTGSGAELYTVIGHAPRHLDRNIALVGRVIEGIEHLSSLPRGTEALGFYKTAQERVPILRIRLASDLPAAERPRFQYLNTEGPTFARYAEARANRRDPFFNVPAGGADICNIPVPVRRIQSSP